jgi:hypothetical protein
MRKVALLLAIIGLALPVLAVSPAQAISGPSPVTWVSGVGTDSGTCARAAPCKTFAFALGGTSAGGEIICVDGGDFGPVTIGFSLTISCQAGNVLVPVSGAAGIGIVAASTDVVTLRGLNIDGEGVGGAGIQVQTAKEAHVENCQIRNFRGNSQAAAINTFAGSTVTIFLYIVDTVISDNSIGVWLQSSGGYKVASLKNVVIAGSTGDGVQLGSSNIYVNITESIISGNFGSAVNVAASSSTANIDRTTMANNVTAALNASASGAIIRTIGNNIFNNTAGFLITGGATIATDNQNRTGGNGGSQVPNAVVTFQ